LRKRGFQKAQLGDFAERQCNQVFVGLRHRGRVAAALRRLRCLQSAPEFRLCVIRVFDGFSGRLCERLLGCPGALTPRQPARKDRRYQRSRENKSEEVTRPRGTNARRQLQRSGMYGITVQSDPLER
jgi:hypothetical protein